ncbi:MAG: starch-binding protein [Flavobacterium sp.]|nr:starch-binding protein [Flavobacterium sp.]
MDATQSPTITVTMANALGTNERVYVYYSTDNFATSGNSAFVQLSALNGSFQGTASIPTFTAGTTVTYYVLTTANTTPTFANVQYQSLNIFNGTAQNTNAPNFSYTVTAAGPTPTITLGTTSGTYSANVGATSGVQTSTVTGANLTANISVTAPAYYEVSSDGGTTWASSATFVQSGGNVNGTLSIRYKPTAGENAVAKTISLTSTGATTVNYTATGTAANSITVQFQQPGDWSGSGYLYAFNGGTLNPAGIGSGWPGLIMTSLGSGWWTYTFTYTNSTVDIIFNNGNNGKQTVNITGVNSSRCYTLTGTGTNYGVSLATCPSGPTIGVTPTTATYSTTVGGTSGSQTFAVSGSFLTADIVVTAPAYYQVSKDNSSWSATGGSVTYTQSGGTVSSTNLFVRYVPTGAESAVAKSVTLTSTGATTPNITVTGTTSSLKVSNAVTGLWTDGSSWVGGVAPSTIDVVQIVNGANITINSNFTQTGAITVDAGGKLTATSPFVTNTSVAINGTFTIGGNLAGGGSPTVTGSGTWTYGSASTLEFRSTNVYHYNTNNDLIWPATNGPFNVSLISATTNQNGLQINNNLARTINGTLLVQNTDNLYKNGSGGYTVNGTVQINTGGVFSNPVVTYGASSTLLFNTGTTVTSMSGPWVTGTGGPGAGLPANVQISNNTTLTIPNNANYTVKGNLTIDSGSAVNTPSANALTVSGSVLNSGTLTLGGSANGDINVGGNWTNSGTFTHNSRTVTFNGTGNQVVSKTGGESFNNVVVNKASGNVLLATSTNVTVSNTLALSAGEFVSGSNTLTLNGTITRIAGTLTTDNSSLVFGPNVAALTLPNSVFTSSPSSLVNLTVNRAGGITLGNQGITVSGTLTLTDGIVTTGSNTLTLNGTITRIAGTLTTDNSSLVFGPNVAALTLPNSVFTSSPSSLVNLTVNRAGGITLGNQGITASGTLTLTDGIVTTGSNIVSLTRSNASPISGGNSSTYINGKLEITYPATGTNIARTFPVGKGGNYRPVTFSYDTAPASRTVLIEQFEAAFPGGVPSSATQFGTRYWNITQSSVGASYKVTLDAGPATTSGTVVMIRREGTGASTSNEVTTPNYTNVTSYNTTDVSNDVSFGECTVCSFIMPAQCGSTLPDINATIYCYGITGATDFRFKVTKAGTDYIFDNDSKNIRAFVLSQIPGVAEYSTTYGVSVSAFIGGVWQAYGRVCTITTPPNITVNTTQIMLNRCGTTLPTLNTTIYANAVVGATQYRFEVTGGSFGVRSS